MEVPLVAMLSRRPKTKIQSIVLHNTHNADSQWIPTNFDIGSWVTLNPGTSGVWARDAKQHGGPSLRGAYKGQIVDWKFSVPSVGREVTNKPRAESILIRWAYAPRQTRLDLDVLVHRPKCNCEYFSFDVVTLLFFCFCALNSQELWVVVCYWQLTNLQVPSCKCVCKLF